MTKKYKVFLTIMITAIIVLVGLNVYLYMSKNKTSVPIEDRFDEDYPFEIPEYKETGDKPDVSLFYYDQLEQDEKTVYDVVKAGIEDALGCEDTTYIIPMADQKLPEDVFEKVMQAVLNDCPELFYMKSYHVDSEGSSLVIDLLWDVDTRKENVEKLTGLVSEVASQVRGENTYDTEVSLQEYIASKCSKEEVDEKEKKSKKKDDSDDEQTKVLSDSEAEPHTPYGALVNGVANEMGYAMAVQMILDACEIPVIHVRGENGSWNIVWVGDQACYLDVYGDDVGQIPDFTYFNMDKSLEESPYYIPDATYFTYPECTYDSASYYKRHDTYFDKFEGDQTLWAIGTLIRNQDIIYLKFSESAYKQSYSILKAKNLFSKYLKHFCTEEVRADWESYYIASNKVFHTVVLYKGTESPF